MDTAMDVRILISIAVIVGILVAVMVAFIMRRRRSGQLKQHLGPEFDRTVIREQGDARSAEAELVNREKHVEAFPSARSRQSIGKAMQWSGPQCSAASSRTRQQP